MPRRADPRSKRWRAPGSPPGLESAGDAAAAAEAYLAAGQVESYPGRVLALGDAARCFADAGQTERALEVFAGLSDSDKAKLPVYVSARLTELGLRTQAGAPDAGRNEDPVGGGLSLTSDKNDYVNYRTPRPLQPPFRCGRGHRRALRSEWLQARPIR